MIVAARVSFALAVLMAAWMARQWAARGRKPHHLAWCIGFGFYAAGTLIEGFLPWTPATLRAYYFVAAFMTAAVLGQGTAYLMFPRRLAHALAALLAGGGAGALAACLLVPLQGPMPAAGHVDMGAFPPALRAATLPFNLYGLGLLAGGAALSIARWRRKDGGGRRVLANALILLGVLVIGAAGAATKAGATQVLLVAELLGLLFLAAGVYAAG